MPTMSGQQKRNSNINVNTRAYGGGQSFQVGHQQQRNTSIQYQTSNQAQNNSNPVSSDQRQRGTMGG